MHATLAVITVLFPMLTTFAQTTEPVLAPDLIIINASIHTMDPAQATAGAVAILGERIVDRKSTRLNSVT